MHLQCDIMTSPTPAHAAFLRLNVSGRHYSISESTIRVKLGGTLFSFLLYYDNNNTTSTETQGEYILDGCIRLETNEYFVERTPSLFELALHYGYTGQLHCPTGVCKSMLLDELRFWRLPEKPFDECCRPDVIEQIEDIAATVAMPISDDRRASSHSEVAIDGKKGPEKRCGYKEIKDLIWRLFDDPSSSVAAKVSTLSSGTRIADVT